MIAQKSTHRAEVVRIKLEQHPNADSLSLVQVYGYQVAVRTQNWRDGDLAAYIPPDSIVPDSPPFAFLKDKNGKLKSRIKAQKLRGIVSFGLLVPAPPGAKEGDDVAEQLGIIHYEPPLPGEQGRGSQTGGEAIAGPPYWCGRKYDVESLRRYPDAIPAGTPVMISEKIHGANGKYTYANGTIFCGSRTEWKKESESNIWWQALRATPALEAFLKTNPGLTVFGEVYGQVQDLKYGVQRGVRFAAFDVMRQDGSWLDAMDCRDFLTGFGVPQVPLIDRVPYDFQTVVSLADGRSLIPGADNIREGVVVKPLKEEWNQAVGRVIFKVVSGDYLSR